MDNNVASLLRRSLDHLAAEVPSSYRRVVVELGSLVVEVVADGEVFSVRADLDRLEVVDGATRAAGARIDTSRATIVDVIDAEMTLAEAVESGRLTALGSLDDILRAYDALIAYANAAVRAPSVPGLLDALRATPDGRQ
jgi:hypothetical protein